MNLQDLRYLVALAEHRHFGRAAEACYVSQPTLSTQLRKLEKELGVKVSSSASAQTAAGRKLGVKKAVLAHPYAETDTARISKSYEHMLDCEVIGKTCWGSPFNRIGAIPQHAAVEMGRKLLKAHPQADTILFPSPHWPTAFALDILEKEFGVTALGAHQGIVWDALRRCGIDDRIEGFGRLLRDF